MGKNKYIETPELLRPDLEFDIPCKKTKEGFYRILPNKRHIGGKNVLRDIQAKKVKKGYVYFITIQNTDTYKIGVSTNPKRRLSDISSVIPFELDVLSVSELENPYQIEQEIIDAFKHKLIKNEWFNLSIKEAKNIMINLHNYQVLQYLKK